MEITPEGAITIRAQKPLELPNPRELGSKIKGKLKETVDSILSGKRKIKEKTQMLSSIIESLSDEDVTSSWSEEQKKRFDQLEEAISGLSKEKPRVIQSVFQEVLPKREGNNKPLARELADILKKPPQTEPEWQKKQEELARGLTVLFAQRQGGQSNLPVPAHSGLSPSESKTGGGQPQPDWDFLIGRTPPSGPPGESPEERTRRERQDETGKGFEIRRRRSFFLAGSVVATVVVLSAILERNSHFPISPVTHLLREQELFGYEKIERKTWVRPMTERALSGTSDYTINEFLTAVYNTQQARKHVLDPHKYDGDGKMFIDELDKELDKDGVPSEQTAEALSQRGIYQHPSFKDGLQAIEDIRTAWDRDEKMTPEQGKNLKDYFTSQKPQFIWPEPIPEE